LLGAGREDKKREEVCLLQKSAKEGEKRDLQGRSQ